MTYSSGGLIQAADYNGFVGPSASGGTAGANINDFWGAGASGDIGWNQTVITNASSATSVTATQWASLVNTLTTAANHTGTSITARTAPTAGNLIQIFAALNTDISNVYTRRGFASGSGTASTDFSGSCSKTTPTGAGTTPWSITFTNTVTFSSATEARYFWNAGGLIKITMSKTSTGTDKDPDWNAFVSTVGTLYLSGRVNSAAQTIAGTSYTGFTRIGGSGSPSPFASTTGWYSLTPGAAATTMFQLNESVYPYASDYIRVTAAVTGSSNAVTFTTTWYDAGILGFPGQTNNISGGTATNTPFSGFGTAPAVVVQAIPPSSTYLTPTWGTQSVSCSVS